VARPGRRYLALQEALAEAQELLRAGDPELKELAAAEKSAAGPSCPAWPELGAPAHPRSRTTTAT
jgi:hypothetical protein